MNKVSNSENFRLNQKLPGAFVCGAGHLHLPVHGLVPTALPSGWRSPALGSWKGPCWTGRALCLSAVWWLWGSLAGLSPVLGGPSGHSNSLCGQSSVPSPYLLLWVYVLLNGGTTLWCSARNAQPGVSRVLLTPAWDTPNIYTSRTAHRLLLKQPGVYFLAQIFSNIHTGAFGSIFLSSLLHFKLFETQASCGCCLTSHWVWNSHLIFVASIFMGFWADQTPSPCPKPPV